MSSEDLKKLIEIWKIQNDGTQLYYKILKNLTKALKVKESIERKEKEFNIHELKRDFVNYKLKKSL